MTNLAGNGYRGTVNIAASGRPCMSWTSVENYKISASLTVDNISEAENYCRRVPFTDWNGPSCFTVDEVGVVRLERCGVDYCGTIFTCVSYAEARNSYRLDVCLSVRPSVRLSVCPSVRLSVRPSVRPSHARIVSKRLNIL